MASEVTELAQHSRQYTQAGKFAGFILEHDIRNRKALITTLALDSRARERFYHLFDGIEHIPARESTLAAAREILSPNEEATRQQKLATLLRNFANLTAEERQELRTLSGGTPD